MYTVSYLELVEMAFCKLKVNWTLSGRMMSRQPRSPDGHNEALRSAKFNLHRIQFRAVE